MKFKKLISNILIVGLLFNSGLSSFAGTLSEDGRYETFEGNNITINDVLEEDKVDIEIEGNTLVNLMHSITQDGVMWRDKNYMITGVYTGHNFEFNSENNSWTWDIGDCLNTIFPVIELPTELMIQNKEYSLIVESNDLVTGIKNTKLNYSDASESISLSDIKKGRNIIKFIYNEDYKNIVFGRINSSSSVKTLSNFMLLEGDWTNKEIPEYFDGIKSVGELEDNKLNIEAIGENLFDVEYFKEMIETHYDEGNYGYEVKDGRNTVWVANNHNRLNGKNILSSNFKFKTNTQYIFKGWIYLDENNSVPHNSLRGHIVYNDNSTDGFFSIPGNNGRWINSSTISNKDKTIKNVLFTYGDNLAKAWFDLDSIYIAEYNPDKTEFNYDYNYKNIEIDLKEPLRGLPTGVKDRIIKRNGQWVVERNLKEITLDGSDDENWRAGSIETSFTHFKIPLSIENIKKQSTLVCEKFKYYNFDNAGVWDFEGISSVNSFYAIVINIDNSRLINKDLNGFKQWLSLNPLKIVYELAEPIYESFDIDLSLNTYLESTYIVNNSIIPCNMKVTVDRIINKAIEAIQLAEENPTISNIAKARMWVNLMKESTLKDDLNNQTNNIVDIEDLTIEKKKVTGNIDIYVKSDNMLLMSLSTNSITFDNFTGTEDMELDDALSITVNSSLPYRLNSYLLSDLQNADGSVTMNRDLLNIKMNNDTNYKAFINLNEKVTLKEDCDAGNNNNHIIDFKLNGSNAHKADVYKAVIKFEAEQK